MIVVAAVAVWVLLAALAWTIVYVGTREDDDDGYF
jgi:hypothetical protein